MPPHIGVAFRRFRGASMRAALMDARPCAVPSRICVGPEKNCSVNFRPFGAYKERSEFGKEFRVSIKSHSSSHRQFFYHGGLGWLGCAFVA